MTPPLSWNAWLARLLPPIPVPPSRRPPDDEANLIARQARRKADTPPDIVPDVP